MPSTDITELTKLKQKVDAAKSEASKAEGALSQVMIRLEKDFGCKTLDQAKTKLKELDRKAEKAKREFEEGLSKFKTDYGDLL